MARRSAADAEQTRRAIVRAARNAFAKHGFAGASTAEIARAAKVTEGAFFHHFRSKKAVFADVLHELESELTAHAIEAGGNDAPAEALLRACRHSLEYAQRPDYQRIVMLDGPTVLGDTDWRRVDSGFGLAALRAGIRRMAPKDALADREIRMLAVAILGVLNETSFALARGERGVSIEGGMAMVERLLDAALRR